MKTIEIELIPNNFLMSANKENVCISSLLGDNIQDLLNNSIKRYSENYTVYNFIVTLRSLYEENKATLENENSLIINNETVISLDEETKELLCLPEEKKLDITIKDKGVVGYNGFYFEYTIYANDEEINPKIQGCFFTIGSKRFMLSPYQYTLFRTINEINNYPEDENKQIEIWKSINTINGISEHLKLTLSALFNREKIIIPAKMSHTVTADKYKNLELKPKLTGLTDEEQELFNKEYEKFSQIQNHYQLRKNDGSSIRIVLSPEVKENVKVIKNTPQVRREKDKKEILTNPSCLYPNPDAVSLEDFSNKVIGFGLYQKVALYNQFKRVNWAFPVYYEVKNLSEKDILITINDREELNVIKELISTAIGEDLPYFSFNEELIPFSEYNLYILNDLLPMEEEEKEEETKNIKTILLTDINNKQITVELTNELIQNLQEQVQKIREYLRENNNNKEYEPLLIINGYQVPLTIENIKKMKKIVEIHLLSDNNSLDVKIFDELKLNSLCKFKEEIPNDLKKEIELKKHQKLGLNWLQNSYRMKEEGREGVLLADDMGLGKTLQILSFLFWLKDNNPNLFKESTRKPILIVAPVILLKNWHDEYLKFFNPTLGEPYILHGNNAKRLIKDGNADFLGKEYYQITKDSGNPKSYLDVEELKKYNIIITNYDTVVTYEYSLKKIDWSIIVLDEAQNIKNENSHKSKVVYGMKSDFKIACTGTPIENSILDLWTIFKFVQDSLLGFKKDFAKNYNDDEMTEEKYKELQDKFYYKKPYTYILRRTKKDELDDIPKKEIVIKNVEMNDEIRNLYKELKSEMRRGGGVQILQQINLLHQHPQAILKNSNNLADTPKIKELITLLNEIKLKNEKALIFCDFKEIQSILKKVLEDSFNLDNITIINGEGGNINLRQNLIDRFSQTTGFNIMILGPRAAGVGLNIVAANHVIHYGRWWNPAVEIQATDRAYRIGQKKDVFVYYLLYHDSTNNIPTFDEYFHNMIMSKTEKADNFLISNSIDLRKTMLEEIQKEVLNL